MLFAYFSLGVVLGFVMGLIFAAIVGMKKPCGTIKFRKDSDGEYIFLELKNGLQDIRGEKTVKFNIDEFSRM